MGKLFEAGNGLRALEVTEERDLAGRVAGLLYLTGAVTVALLPLMPGVPVDNATALIVICALGLVWGAACLFVIPWRRVHPLVSHLSSAMGLPVTAIAMAATGGADSPARFYLFFIVFFVSYFYPPREAIPHLFGCVAVLLVPLAYDPGAVDGGLLAETLILAPTFFVLGGLIMGGKQIMLSLSRHDPLTGLVNRRAFDSWFVGAVDGRATAQPFGLMFCDLDAFKTVNDRHGHPEGDRVLREVAAALEGAVRGGDLVARVGGDEFAIVVPGADDDSMAALAERLHSELHSAGVGLGLNGYDLNASIGWAIYPDDAGDREHLVAIADEALRGQKRSCSEWVRQRVIVARSAPIAD